MHLIALYLLRPSFLFLFSVAVGLCIGVSLLLLTRTSTSFEYWVFRVSADVKNRILRCWRNVRMLWRDSSINHGQRKAHSLTYCNQFSGHFWWDVVFDSFFQWYVYPWSSQSFPSERTAGVFSRSITVTNKSNSRTYTVASSFVLHFAVGCHYHYRIFRYPHGLQFGFVQVFLADHVHACSEICHKLSFFGFNCGCGRQKPLLRRQIECSFVFLFELKDIPGKSPRVSASASLLSFGLFLRSVLKFHGVGTALRRNFDLNFSERWTFFFLGCLLDAKQPLWTVLVEMVPTLVCTPETVTDSGGWASCDTQPNCRTLFAIATALLSSPFFRLFCLVVLQPSIAGMSTLRRTYIPI